MVDILTTAGVSAGSFHNIFRTKDGVLLDLTEFMFTNQFNIAEMFLGENTDLLMVYALETAIQLAISELNENIRQIYIEAYTYSKSLAFINRKTAEKLSVIFKNTMPGYTEADFYEIEIGTSGMMRSFMIKKCDMYFTLERKIKRFLSMSLTIFGVTESIRDNIINAILQQDIRKIADSVIQKLFAELSMHYDFTLPEIRKMNNK